jgi:hypothetical protein
MTTGTMEMGSKSWQQLTVNVLLVAVFLPLRIGTTGMEVQQFWICVRRKSCKNRALDLTKIVAHSGAHIQ